MTSQDAAARRAGRLLRWYPKAWRSRFGEEFAELLISDIRERPRSRARTADVARGGIVARLAEAGLCGCAPEAPEQVRTTLAALICCVAVFLGCGAAMWSQLTTGWQWSEPDATGTAVAMVMMSAAMLAFAILAVLAALPVAASAARSRGKALAGPLVLFLAGAVVVFLGGRHFGNGWPGTGGHPWGRQGLVPGGIAAFAWASTLSVSSYWVHPSALAGFPAAELAWMAVSPLAVACAVAGAAQVVRRSALSPGALLFEARLGVAACGVMVVFLGGFCSWVLGEIGGGPGPGGLFHAGTIDVAAAAVMAIALALARQAAYRARLGVLRLGTR
jgi:hypothetical protein